MWEIFVEAIGCFSYLCLLATGKYLFVGALTLFLTFDISWFYVLWRNRLRVSSRFSWPVYALCIFLTKKYVKFPDYWNLEKKYFFRKRFTKTIEYFLYLEYLWQASCTSYYLGSFSEIPLCCGKLNGFPHHLSIVFQIGISKSHSESWQLRSSWIHLGHLSQPVLWSCFSHIHLSKLLSILLHSDCTLVSLITNRKHLQYQKVNKLLGWNWIAKHISILGSPFACQNYPASKTRPLLKICYPAFFSSVFRTVMMWHDRM